MNREEFENAVKNSGQRIHYANVCQRAKIVFRSYKFSDNQDETVSLIMAGFIVATVYVGDITSVS
ncbi:MAG: hypothetical protein QXG05_03915 [Nitrososphaerota archaeon]